MLAGLVALIEIPRVDLFGKAATRLELETHAALAESFRMQKLPAQSAAELSKVLRLNPDHDLALNNLAVIRAASSWAELRNGSEAVRLAERACELTSYKTPRYVGTLAMAYAEAGRFDDAVAKARLARQLALAGGDRELARAYSALIEGCGARKPVRLTDQD